MIKIDFHIKPDGKIPESAKEKLRQTFISLADKNITLTIEKYKKKRGIQQLRYYWGVVIPLMADYMGYSTSEYEIVHSILKEMFLRTIEIKNDKEYARVKSTSELSTIDFMGYISDIQRFATEECNIIIPDPNQEEFLEDKI